MALAMEHDSSLAEVSKQAAKALKCVASTSKQVGDMLARKHERILKRVRSISEEIESLKTDVMENITHQRERRLQLTEIEEDVEQAQLLGNGAMVEELLEELQVLKEEAKREDSLYRALCKTVRSRKETKKIFMRERVAVEDEIRTFNCKQKLIQTLLATCTQQCGASDNTQGSSASQSDCGASALEDIIDVTGHESPRSSSSGDSFPSNPLDSPMFVPSSPSKKSLNKAVSLEPSPAKRTVRVRSWSSDCVQPLPPREPVQTRTRHSLSVHFASPVLAATRKESDSMDEDIESLDLSGYMASIDEKPTEKTAVAEDEPKAEETEPHVAIENCDEPHEPTPQEQTEETQAAPSPVKHLPVPVPDEEVRTAPVETPAENISPLVIEDVKRAELARPTPVKTELESESTETATVVTTISVSTSAAA